MAKYPKEPERTPDILLGHLNRLNKYVLKSIYWTKGYASQEDRATGRLLYFTLYPNAKGYGYHLLKRPHLRASDAIAYRAEVEERAKRLADETNNPD